MAIQDIQKYENKIVINLPKPYVIVLEESRDVPDKYEFIMRLDEKELRYECNVLRYFEYDIETSKDQQNVKQLKYVAMSRAKNKVIYVTQGKDIVTENTAVKESEDSNFIADLSEKGIQRKTICNNK